MLGAEELETCNLRQHVHRGDTSAMIVAYVNGNGLTRTAKTGWKLRRQTMAKCGYDGLYHLCEARDLDVIYNFAHRETNE